MNGIVFSSSENYLNQISILKGEDESARSLKTQIPNPFDLRLIPQPLGLSLAKHEDDEEEDWDDEEEDWDDEDEDWEDDEDEDWDDEDEDDDWDEEEDWDEDEDYDEDEE